MNLIHYLDKHVSCREHNHQYVPPLWIMCLESVAHLLVMLNSSSNFLIYCSVSKQFKTALSRTCLGLVRKKERQENRNISQGVINIKDITGEFDSHLDNTKEKDIKINFFGHLEVTEGLK